MTFLLTCYIALIILMLIIPLILILDKFSKHKGKIKTFFLKIKLRRIKKLQLTITQLENKNYELQSKNEEISANNANLNRELTKEKTDKQHYFNQLNEYKTLYKETYEIYSRLIQENNKIKSENKLLQEEINRLQSELDKKNIILEATKKQPKYTNIYISNQLKETEFSTPKEITQSKQQIETEKPKIIETFNNTIDYRTKHKKPFRCKDGDYVRSKSEREIDDFLFDNKIWHIYEKEYTHPQTGKKAEPDFYLSDYNLYIEYFGMSDPDYIKRRDEKIKMYQSDKSINFEYLTYKDDYCIYEKLINICQKYSIPAK